MEKKEEQLKRDSNKMWPFDINTGWIFSDLEKQFRKFDRNFLIEKVEPALQSCLLKNEVVTLLKDENNRDYFEKARSEYLNFRSEEGKFPLPGFFISQDRLYQYDSECILNINDTHFPLFFALKLSLASLMDVHQIIAYQLKTNFHRNITKLEQFITVLLIEYKELINENVKQLADGFMQDCKLKNESRKTNKERLMAIGTTENLGNASESSDKASEKFDVKEVSGDAPESLSEDSPQMQDVNNTMIGAEFPNPDKSEDISEANPEKENIGIPTLEQEDNIDSATIKQCLAFYYILCELKVVNPKTAHPLDEENVERSDIHKFIRFFTGKNQDNIKKGWNKMLGKISEKSYRENLRNIRSLFEEINLKSVLDRINKDLTPKGDAKG